MGEMRAKIQNPEKFENVCVAVAGFKRLLMALCKISSAYQQKAKPKEIRF